MAILSIDTFDNVEIQLINHMYRDCREANRSTKGDPKYAINRLKGGYSNRYNRYTGEWLSPQITMLFDRKGRYIYPFGSKIETKTLPRSWQYKVNYIVNHAPQGSPIFM